jgi:hypothetical protein
MSLADEIEKVGRAPTAKELAGFLCFSEVQSTSMSPPDGFLRSGSEPDVRFDPQSVANWLRRM